tara:strand:- start:12410 stop:13126 length:717 start_codon:yes stop_codon:yes gene_type:complete
MKALFLTTDTPHHNYFIRRFKKKCGEISVVYETSEVIPSYPTKHPFEYKRDQFEIELWGNQRLTLSPNEVSCLKYVENINQLEIDDHITQNKDVCIVFGTRKINFKTLERLPPLTANLHGGDPELYRGLDSHLWSIWHRDKKGLKTCLHLLKQELDSGEILEMESLNLSRTDKIIGLRAKNTSLCVKLCNRFFDKISDGSPLNPKPQKNNSRYYSFMPTELKNIVVNRFEILFSDRSS